MCFAAGVSLWYFLGGAFALTALSPILWNWDLIMPEYRRMRILRGFEPGVVDDWTFQVRRSMQAIGSGGVFGKGWQQGPITQGWSARVPEQWTDFIFSAIGEEFGFIGAIFTIIILTLIIVRIFIISKNARNNVGSLICAGVMAMFIAQIIINIGMCLGMLPVIGITLPFFSYGGSSILSSLLGIGMVLSVNSRRNIYYFTRDENIGE
jgi:rod shape determining protein RodA